MAAADMYATVAGAGLKDGTDWDIALDYAAFENDYENNSEAGDRYFLMGGETYTLTSHLGDGTRDGTNAAYIEVIGVAPGTTAEPPTLADWAVEADYPLFACGAFTVYGGEYWRFAKLKFTASASRKLHPQTGSQILNTVHTQTGGANQHVIYNNGTADTMLVMNNRFIQSSKNNAMCCYLRNYNTFIGNHCSGGSHGLQGYNRITATFNIVNDCVIGIRVGLGSFDDHKVINNTVHDCTNGIDCQDAYRTYLFNNTVSSCTNGILWTIARPTSWIDWNNYWNNGVDVALVSKGPNAMAVDPMFRDAPNGDFLPRNWANMLGFPGTFPGGLSDGAGLICGAVQPKRMQMIGAGLRTGGRI